MAASVNGAFYFCPTDFHCLGAPPDDSEANVPVVPGTDNPLTDPSEAVEFVKTVAIAVNQHVAAR